VGHGKAEGNSHKMISEDVLRPEMISLLTKIICKYRLVINRVLFETARVIQQPHLVSVLIYV